MTTTKLVVGVGLLAAAVVGITTPPDAASWTVWPLLLLAAGGALVATGLLDVIEGE